MRPSCRRRRTGGGFACAVTRPGAWAVAIGLLVADLFLPVPATGVMAALGSVYGPVLGALVGAVGSAMAGLLGYGLARVGGQPVARRPASRSPARTARNGASRQAAKANS
ncbi:MAG: hypothetical protein U9R68_04995, partial [Planctomycetota bacterium]|nr:hypothetical protein [Planctomycetota bacterium]